MPDMTVTTNGELMVAGVEAESDDGAEFVDAWLPERPGAKYEVVDSGRIVLEQADSDEFVAAARARGLDVEVTTQ